MENIRKVGRNIKKHMHRDDKPQDAKEWDFDYKRNSKRFTMALMKDKPVHIEDLSLIDQERIRHLAEKEFQQLAKVYAIELHLKDKLKYQAEKITANIANVFGSDSVFGVQLRILMERDQKVFPHGRIPLVAEMLFDILNKRALEVKGVISSPSTDTATVSDVKSMMAKDFYGNRESIERRLMESSPKTAGDILKFFIRHLPNTLFTSAYAHAFYQLGKIGDEVDRLKATKMLIFQLPDVNRNVLADLMALLQNIAGGKGSDRNETLVNGLALVVTPILFDMSKAEKEVLPANQVVSDPYVVTQLMIRWAHFLFVVPPFFLRAIKEKQQRDDKDKPLPAPVKKDKPSPAPTSDVRKGELVITAPQFNVIKRKFPVTPLSTGDDVTRLFFDYIKDKKAPPGEIRRLGVHLCLQEHHKYEMFVQDHALFETGGNIAGERKIHKDTNIADALWENPKGKWYIRCTHTL